MHGPRGLKKMISTLRKLTGLQHNSEANCIKSATFRLRLPNFLKRFCSYWNSAIFMGDTPICMRNSVSFNVLLMNHRALYYDLSVLNLFPFLWKW